MRRRRKLFYDVSSFAGLWWSNEYKRWVRSGDDKGKKGCSDTITCKTKNSALRHIRAMQSLTNGEVYYNRFEYKKGERWCTTFYFGEYQKPKDYMEMVSELLELNPERTKLATDALSDYLMDLSPEELKDWNNV